MMTVGEAILKSAQWLKGKDIETPRLDAELLLARILNCDRLRIYMDWQKPLTDLEVSGYREYIRRRGQDHEPVARIIESKEFFGRRFHVSPHTFVPRPETEGLVERALTLLQNETVLSEQRRNIFEIGTGTGCIIVSIAAESDAHEYIASDVSGGALETARRNAKTHGVDGRIDFRHGANFAGFGGSLGMIVSNPPYIRSGEIPELPPEVRVFDPRPALDGGQDGLDVVRAICSDGHKLLIHGGWTLLEIGEEQGPPCKTLFTQHGGYDQVRVERDLEGRERYVMARKG
jgi:release factor glutamine methyltransferase